MTDNKHIDYSHLTTHERISLVQKLWDSVHAHAAEIPLTDAEQEEPQRRWADYESGSAKASLWPVVKKPLLNE